MAPGGCPPAAVALIRSDPPAPEKASQCGTITTASNTGGALLGQVPCDTGFGGCPAGSTYPKPSAAGVIVHPLPANLPTMANPCQGAPPNAWCKAGKPI